MKNFALSIALLLVVACSVSFAQTIEEKELNKVKQIMESNNVASVSLNIDFGTPITNENWSDVKSKLLGLGRVYYINLNNDRTVAEIKHSEGSDLAFILKESIEGIVNHEVVFSNPMVEAIESKEQQTN